VIVYAAIDIHKHAFQAAVLDPESGELVEARLPWHERPRRLSPNEHEQQ